MYPIALEKQYQRFFVKEFRKLALPYTNGIIKKLKEEIKADSSNTIRADSITQLMIFLSEIRKQYGDKVSSQDLSLKIEKNFSLIDAWSRDKTNEAITKLYARLNTPQQSSVTGRSTPKNMPGELWMPTINLRKTLNDGLIDDVVKKNVNLINDAYKSHFDEMAGIIKNGLQSGKGIDAIADELRYRTGVNISKAKFWARDQASKFFGETTRLRQQGAGIKGYIWRCVGGRRTRDSHLALEGTYHDWNNPPIINGRACHPGDDYNCRCWAEPAMGPEAAEKEYKGPADDNYFENIRPGSEPAGFNQATEGLSGRTVFNIENPGLKYEAEKTLSAINSFLKVDMGKNRALSVVQMASSDPYFETTLGYHFKSGHIALKAGSIYERSTLVHELSHYIDLKLLPQDARINYKEIINGIEKSDAYKELKQIKKLTKDSETREYLEYLLTPTELFARAMEQYMATAGIDDIISDQFFRKRKDYELHYWVDSDFEKIYFLIERMFRDLKWQ